MPRLPRVPPRRTLVKRTSPPVFVFSMITGIPTVIMMGISLIILMMAKRSDIKITQPDDLQYTLWLTIMLGAGQLTSVYSTLCLVIQNTYKSKQALNLSSKLVLDFFMGTLCTFLSGCQYVVDSQYIATWIPNLIIMSIFAFRVREHLDSSW